MNFWTCWRKNTCPTICECRAENSEMARFSKGVLIGSVCRLWVVSGVHQELVSVVDGGVQEADAVGPDRVGDVLDVNGVEVPSLGIGLDEELRVQVIVVAAPEGGPPHNPLAIDRRAVAVVCGSGGQSAAAGQPGWSAHRLTKTWMFDMMTSTSRPCWSVWPGKPPSVLKDPCKLNTTAPLVGHITEQCSPVGLEWGVLRLQFQPELLAGQVAHFA